MIGGNIAHLCYYYKEGLLGWVSDFCRTDLPDIFRHRTDKTRQRRDKTRQNSDILGQKLAQKCLQDCYLSEKPGFRPVISRGFPVNVALKSPENRVFKVWQKRGGWQ